MFSIAQKQCRVNIKGIFKMMILVTDWLTSNDTSTQFLEVADVKANSIISH